jgi:siroheme synthase
MSEPHAAEPRVYFVGAGPGAADLLTLRAIRVLARAEFVLHDALVEPTVLELAPHAARLRWASVPRDLLLRNASSTRR